MIGQTEVGCWFCRVEINPRYGGGFVLTAEENRPAPARMTRNGANLFMTGLMSIYIRIDLKCLSRNFLSGFENSTDYILGSPARCVVPLIHPKKSSPHISAIRQY